MGLALAPVTGRDEVYYSSTVGNNRTTALPMHALEHATSRTVTILREKKKSTRQPLIESLLFPSIARICDLPRPNDDYRTRIEMLSLHPLDLYSATTRCFEIPIGVAHVFGISLQLSWKQDRAELLKGCVRSARTKSLREITRSVHQQESRKCHVCVVTNVEKGTESFTYHRLAVLPAICFGGSLESACQNLLADHRRDPHRTTPVATAKLGKGRNDSLKVHVTTRVVRQRVLLEVAISFES